MSVPPSTSVARTPSAPDTGPASAWPAGIRQRESSQSIEPTRARRSGRTSCCIAVSQSVLPKMIVALRIALAAMIARTGSGGTREKGRMAPIAQTANAAATGLPGRIR